MNDLIVRLASFFWRQCSLWSGARHSERTARLFALGLGLATLTAMLVLLDVRVRITRPAMVVVVAAPGGVVRSQHA